jgi:RNA polymerase sigma factor (sigma-70 family)
VSDARGLVEHLFRHQAGRLVARLTRVFGPAHLELAEDVVQEALMAALDTWPYRGVPDDPAAWLARVAKNRAFDALRRSATLADREAELRAWTPDAEATGDTVAGELPSDDLLMVFTCCHPDIGAESRVALTLKTLGGFGVREIARAFLSSETTIAQRLVRAKRRLRASGAGFELPRPAELGERLGSVLEVLYLLFNEGYASTAGEALLREDVMDEALRLTDLLLAHAPTAVPEAHALAALMLFQSARNPARVDGSGGLLLLAEQDRGRWDAARIQAGFRRLAAARGGDALNSAQRRWAASRKRRRAVASELPLRAAMAANESPSRRSRTTSASSAGRDARRASNHASSSRRVTSPALGVDGAGGAPAVPASDSPSRRWPPRAALRTIQSAFCTSNARRSSKPPSSSRRARRSGTRKSASCSRSDSDCQRRTPAPVRRSR